MSNNDLVLGAIAIVAIVATVGMIVRDETIIDATRKLISEFFKILL